MIPKCFVSFSIWWNVSWDLGLVCALYYNDNPGSTCILYSFISINYHLVENKRFTTELNTKPIALQSRK